MDEMDTHPDWEKNLESPQIKFSIGDEVFIHQQGFGVVTKCEDNKIEVLLHNGLTVIHKLSEFGTMIGHFNSIAELQKYDESYWPLAFGYNENVSKHVIDTNKDPSYEDLLIICPFPDDIPTMEPILMVFRNELDAANYIGISISMTSCEYKPYWKMTEKFSKEEFDLFIKIMNQKVWATNYPSIPGEYVTGWEFAKYIWNDYVIDDYPQSIIPDNVTMPDYQFNLLG